MAEHIPKEFLELLLQRADLVNLVDARVPLRKKTGHNYFACCPFHQEKTASFSVNHTKQFYYCFGCGAHGNAIDFLMQYDRLHFVEAVDMLAKQIGLAVPHAKMQEKTASLQHLYALLDKVAQFYHTELSKTSHALAYFKQRGLSTEIIKTFHLGFAPRDVLSSLFEKKELEATGMLSQKEGKYFDRFRERIMFPIQDRRGRFIGFGGRVLDNSEPKYLNSPETALFQKGHELYGLYQVLKTNRQLPRLLIVEGYMDMISLFQQGVTYAIATLGTATTSYHIQSLFRYTGEIIFCFDGDNAGRRAAWRALQVIFPIAPDNIQFRFMFLPDGEDPDSFIRKTGKAHFEKCMQEAPTLTQYFFHTLAHDIDLTTADGKARFIKSALDLIQDLPPGILKQTLLVELGQKTRTDVKAWQQSKKTAAPLSVPKNSSASKRSSILRYALTLLIQYPSLAQHLSNPLDEDMSGADLFNQVWKIAAKNTSLSTGAILEHWREQKEEKWLASLAQQELTIPVEGLKSEFLGAIQQIQKQSKAQTIQKLLEKAAIGIISPEERTSLSAMIINKNKFV